MQTRASIPIAGWAGCGPARSAVRMPWAKSASRAASGAVRPRMLAVRTRVELAELDAVGERAQVDVVDQHRPPEPDAQRVDDLLERDPSRSSQTTSPWRIVSSVTTRGSTKCSR